MGEFKGFMNYDKQQLDELSLVERISNHDAFQQRFTKDEAAEQGARCMDCGTPFCQTRKPHGKETIGYPLGIIFRNGMISFIEKILKQHMNA